MSGQDLALAQALLSHLKDDNGLQALVGDPARIWDHVPPGALVPYLALVPGRSRPLAGADGAFEHEIELVCTSRFRGTEEARAVLAATRLALHQASLTVGEVAITRLELGAERISVSRDGAVTSGRLALRAVSEPTS
ncbi:MAG: DUF3168 domain-containing protein [Brevundimonas sp.]|nr:MAG: DUF3168 domain-containing protein [Brevundimonas sp.]